MLVHILLRLRNGSALFFQLFQRFGRARSQSNAFCNAVEDVHYLLCLCYKYTKERKVLCVFPRYTEEPRNAKSPDSFVGGKTSAPLSSRSDLSSGKCWIL